MSAVTTIDRRDAIAFVRVNSPPVNALSVAVRAGILEAIEAVSQDERVLAVVLVCDGRTFSHLNSLWCSMV